MNCPVKSLIEKMAKFQESNWPPGKHLQQIISYQLAEVWKQKNFLIFLLRMKALRQVGSQSLNRYLFFKEALRIMVGMKPLFFSMRQKLYLR